MNLHEQAEKDFVNTRKEDFLRRLEACLRRDPCSNRLVSFEETSATGQGRSR